MSEQDTNGTFLKPLPGRILIKRDEAKSHSSVIYIPEKHRQLPTTGRIVAVGDEERQDWVGKRVVWGRFSGVPLFFSGGLKFDVLTPEEILAFVQDDTAEIDLESLAALNREG